MGNPHPVTSLGSKVTLGSNDKASTAPLNQDNISRGLLQILNSPSHSEEHHHSISVDGHIGGTQTSTLSSSDEKVSLLCDEMISEKSHCTRKCKIQSILIKYIKYPSLLTNHLSYKDLENFNLNEER